MRIQHVNVHRPVDNLTRPAQKSAQWGQILFEIILEFTLLNFKTRFFCNSSLKLLNSQPMVWKLNLIMGMPKFLVSPK